MRAGRLRHRIALYAPSLAQDGYGQATPSYALSATVWGAVEPASGSEKWVGDQISAEVVTRIRIRYRTGLDTTFRAVHDGITYNILEIRNVNTRDRELWLICGSGMNDGY